jgi:hypothetical protein
MLEPLTQEESKELCEAAKQWLLIGFLSDTDRAEASRLILDGPSSWIRTYSAVEHAKTLIEGITIEGSGEMYRITVINKTAEYDTMYGEFLIEMIRAMRQASAPLTKDQQAAWKQLNKDAAAMQRSHSKPKGFK